VLNIFADQKSCWWSVQTQ